MWLWVCVSKADAQNYRTKCLIDLSMGMGFQLCVFTIDLIKMFYSLRLWLPVLSSGLKTTKRKLHK